MKRLLFLAAAFMVSLGLYAQSVTISGTVTQAEDNTPLPGVSVVAEGTTIGTITSFDGTYAITVPSTVENLRFTFVGLETQVIPIGSQTTIDVALASSTEELDEVIVTGYGSKRKGAITGSVGIVNADAIESLPVASFDGMLQGQVAGVQVIGSSGAPGASSTVRIRGISSIEAGTAPLYIMDGIEITAGDFSSLNPNDIQNISILKDATAVSIYGSKGANGVMVITTKRGRNNQKTDIIYRTQYGQSSLAREQFDMMTSAEKIDYEIHLGDRSPDNPANDSLRNVNTVWRDEVFRTAPYISHELVARGGNERTAFYVSGNYLYQDGIEYRSNMERFSFRVNLDHQASDKLKFGLYMTAGNETKENPTTATNNVYNLGFRAYLENPYTSVYRADGSYATPEDGLIWANPIQQLDLNDDLFSQFKSVASIFAEYSILPYLKFKTTFGTDFDFTNRETYLSPLSAWGGENQGEVFNAAGRTFRLTNTNLLTFNRAFGEHEVTAFLGEETINYSYSDFDSEGYKLANPYIKTLGATATAGEPPTSDLQEYSVLSFFANASYNYQRKYYLDLSIRRDGSSKFGVDSRWGTFWSAGAHWDMKREAFLADSELITQLKIKASVGTTGNNRIGNYLHLATYGYGGTYYGENASYPTKPGNNLLTWEKVFIANLAVDMQFANRFNVILEAYHKPTTDMLFAIPLSRTTGFRDGWDNVVTMVNQGVEASVSADVIRTADLRWNISLNASYNHNEITGLYGDKEFLMEGDNLIIEPGYPYGSWFMNEYLGVNAANGKRLWRDVNGNVTDDIRDSDMTHAMKSWIAPWQGGISTSVSWKGLSAQAIFSWVQGKYMVNNTRYFTESNGQFSFTNQSTAMFREWSEPGDITDIPKADGVNYFDTRLLEDASFMRLKNVSVSYIIPQDWADATRVFKGFKVFAQGQNLLTWTKYLGFDPEVDSAYELGTYPMVKTWTIGLEATF